MPVLDLLLAEPPAEQHLLAAAAGGEVDETAVDVLDDRADLVDRLDAAREARGRRLDPPLERLQLARLDAPTVAGDPGCQLRLTLLRLGERAAVLDHPLRERLHGDERAIRLLRGEVASSHEGYDRSLLGAGQRLVESRPAGRELRVERGRDPAPELFLWSRAAIWAAVVFAFLAFGPLGRPLASRWDDPTVTHDLGFATDVWARWDSVWFLRIAEHGYGVAAKAPAFYPLYPGLVGALGRVLAGHYLLAGILVSLAASLGAFLLLYRLAECRLGADGGRRAVLYLAVFPMALFLQAVYSESVYLFLVLAAFALAERGRFLEAGVVAGLALLARPTAVALLAGLALLAWRTRRRWPALAGLALAPALFVLYPLWLWRDVGDPWAFTRAEGAWRRHLSPAGPFGGIWDGLRAAFAGVEQLVSGSHTRVYWTAVRDTDPLRVATVNLENLAFLVFFVVLTVVAWRRFGAPYGLFAALSLTIPLSVPSSRWPLLSLPRFGLVVFPFFLALASLGGGRPRAHAAIVGVSSLLLGVAVVQWALWQWVS